MHCLFILQISFQSLIPLYSQGYTSGLQSYRDCVKKKSEFQDVLEEYIYDVPTFDKKPWC